ncbi:M67 family metallopeptidase [Natronoglycomyces albus]|uniref:M67 family metallopeptidase n=2 Tax=Natronoglycomyces albus TaxID=2811108 RepID=A0A895XUB8_9ACTN|nr:M67 family metallopeptidase [Natronoglycomyces albus]
MIAHARADHPDEACGIIAGPAVSGEPQRHIPMTNAARSTTFYEFDSTEWLQVYNGMEDADEIPTVIYHSHTATEAYPSRTDASIAAIPEAHYVLIATRDPDVAQVRSFRIIDGQITEEAICVTGAPDDVQSYKFAHTPDAVIYDCR